MTDGGRPGQPIGHYLFGAGLTTRLAHLGVSSGAVDDAAGPQREQELLLVLERLEHALDGARTGLWDWSIATGVITWSAHTEALFGFEPGAFTGTADEYQSRIHPDDREMVQAAIAQAIADPAVAYGVEHRVARRDGTVRWVEGRGYVYRDSAGNPVRMAGSVTDITERKEAEHALRLSEERFRQLAEASSEGVFVVENGVIVDANPQLGVMFGQPPDDIVGHHVFEFVAEEAVADVQGHIARGGVSAYGSTGRRVDGTTFPVDVRAQPLHAAAGGRRLVVLRDLTATRRGEDDRLALEREVQHSQKLESLGVLAGGIAHDFNNLLVAMLGNLELALGDLPARTDVRTYLLDAESAAKRAAALTAKLLAYSGRGRFEVRPVSINQLIGEMTTSIHNAVRRTLRVKLCLGTAIPKVEGDPTQIHQLVMNLIVNAAESIGDGPGEISLTTGIREWTREDLRAGYVPDVADAGRFVFLTVTDTGAGMDDAVKARLFEPFFTTKFTGRGLGMAAVIGILRAHKGTIFVDSTPGQGASITALFPTQLSRADSGSDSDTVARPQPAPMLSAERPTVLIVDDEEAVRSICRQMIDRLGYAAEAVAGGQEALDLLRQPAKGISCVLLDLTMPGMDGAETAAAIQKLRPSLPIVIASGFSESEVVERLGPRHVASVVQKPYRMATLRDVLAPLVPPSRP
jgi:PAS domain S-box-containing protein